MHARRFHAVFLATVTILAAASWAPAAVEFHVATTGADANVGTAAAPFATLGRARDAIRDLKKAGPLPAGGVTVWVHGGVYFLASPLKIDAQDSGTAEAPVVYRSVTGQEVRLTGGREVAGFKPVADAAVLQRLDEAARGKVLVADLKAQGITDFGEMKPRGFGRSGYSAALELFFQDKPMPLARYPNEGWMRIAKVPDGPQGGKFGYDGDRPLRWKAADDAWLHGYWTQDWADSYEKVASIDTEKREIATVAPHGVYGYKAKQRFRALNLLEEIDEPGEWYLDRKEGLLYFWPPAALESGKAYASVGDALAVISKASYVTLRGFILECCRGTAVKVDGGTKVVVAGCTIRNVGTQGVTISNATESGVVGCDVYDVGDAGINLSGGDRKTLTPAGLYARNNDIRRFGRWCRTYRPAIGVHGVGNLVSHNRMSDAPHAALFFGGNENVVELNEVFNVCRDTDDVGGFYIGRDWTQRGNVIRYNYFHDILSGSDSVRCGSRIVYLDDAASGTIITGNVFYKAGSLCGVNVGGGRDNVIENNVFVDCKAGVLIDSRGIGWAKKFIATDGDWGMYKKLAGVNYKEPPYSTKYPALAAILDNEPAKPMGNRVVRNVCVGGKLLELPGTDKAWVTVEKNFEAGDPLFIDAAKKNFQFRSDSPVWKLGFQRIPFDKIGLEKDAYRTKLTP